MSIGYIAQSWRKLEPELQVPVLYLASMVTFTTIERNEGMEVLPEDLEAGI